MIVWALAGDGDVVDVAFAKSGAGDAHEARLLLELGDGLRPDIAHGGAQASGELVHGIRAAHTAGCAPSCDVCFEPRRGVGAFKTRGDEERGVPRPSQSAAR